MFVLLLQSEFISITEHTEASAYVRLTQPGSSPRQHTFHLLLLPSLLQTLDALPKSS